MCIRDRASINSKEFTVTIRNTDEIKNAQSIAIPVWSEYNGQDDIIWYLSLIHILAGNIRVLHFLCSNDDYWI